MANDFEVRGYSKTGIYSVNVKAVDANAAQRKARPKLARMAFGKLRTVVATAVTH